MNLELAKSEYVERKRQAGDRWGLISIDKATGEKRAVQIGYWESTTWPYPNQAQEQADYANQLAVEINENKYYEIRFIGNSKTNCMEDNSDVQGTGFAGWGFLTS